MDVKISDRARGPKASPDRDCIIALCVLFVNMFMLFYRYYIAFTPIVLYHRCIYQVFRAAVAELVDALASGASVRKYVEVQVLFAAPKTRCIPSATLDPQKNLQRTNLHSRFVVQVSLRSSAGLLRKYPYGVLSSLRWRSAKSSSRHQRLDVYLAY